MDKNFDKLYDEHSDTQTVYHHNGDIKVTPASYELAKNVAPEVTKLRGTVTMQENGTFFFRADRPGCGPRFETVFETEHARVRRRTRLPKPGGTLTEIDFRFPLNIAHDDMAASLVDEVVMILDYLKKH